MSIKRKRVWALLSFPALLAMAAAALFSFTDNSDAEVTAMTEPQEQPFVGGIVEDRERVAAQPKPVRNDVSREGTEIIALRYFRIKKGTFDEFYKVSREGVWPFFEKIGSRTLGQWRIIHPTIDGRKTSEETPDYDEVYMATRYASIEHWRATRDMAAIGGNGPDWVKCREALAHRRTLTLESSVTFLQGTMNPGGPFYLPGLDEEYRRLDE